MSKTTIAVLIALILPPVFCWASLTYFWGMSLHHGFLGYCAAHAFYTVAMRLPAMMKEDPK